VVFGVIKSLSKVPTFLKQAFAGMLNNNIDENEVIIKTNAIKETRNLFLLPFFNIFIYIII
jgi:hypothetical protein